MLSTIEVNVVWEKFSHTTLTLIIVLAQMHEERWGRSNYGLIEVLDEVLSNWVSSLVDPNTAKKFSLKSKKNLFLRPL